MALTHSSLEVDSVSPTFDLDDEHPGLQPLADTMMASKTLKVQHTSMFDNGREGVHITITTQRSTPRLC